MIRIFIKFPKRNSRNDHDGVWTTGTWESTKDFEFGAMPIPKFYDQEATWGDSHTIILPLTQDEDEAKRKAAMIFADWVADNGQVWAKAGHIPSKPSVLEKQEFKDMPYRSDYSEVASVVKFSKNQPKLPKSVKKSPLNF